MRAKPSDALLTLTDEVRDLGAGWVKAKQVQHWQEYGLIEPTLSYPGRGHGSGSVSAYPPATAEAVARFAQLVRLLRSIDAATIVLFLEGFPVGERGIKRALRSVVAGMPEASTENPWNEARNMAKGTLVNKRGREDRSVGGRALRQFFGASLSREELENVLGDLARTMLGQPAPVDPSRKQSTPSLVRSLHLEKEYGEDPLGTARILNSNMSRATKMSLMPLVEEATLGDLERARVLLEPLLKRLPQNAIEATKPGLRRDSLMLLTGVFLTAVHASVFERVSVKAGIT